MRQPGHLHRHVSTTVAEWCGPLVHSLVAPYYNQKTGMHVLHASLHPRSLCSLLQSTNMLFYLMYGVRLHWRHFSNCCGWSLDFLQCLPQWHMGGWWNAQYCDDMCHVSYGSDMHNNQWGPDCPSRIRILGPKFTKWCFGWCPSNR